LERTVDEAVAASGDPPSSGECLKQNILVVEDNQLNRELLCDWLEMEGYEVWFAANLKTSYEVLAKRLPNAVLLDINLGAENGLDLVAWMQQKPSLGEILSCTRFIETMNWMQRQTSGRAGDCLETRRSPQFARSH
jgi:CheY-like chemotaxis protein